MWFGNSHPSFTLNIGLKTTLILTILVIENELIYWLNEQKGRDNLRSAKFSKLNPHKPFFSLPQNNNTYSDQIFLGEVVQGAQVRAVQGELDEVWELIQELLVLVCERFDLLVVQDQVWVLLSQ